MESVKSAVANGTTIDPKSLIDYIANINDVVNTMKNHITRGVAECSATSPFAAALCGANTTLDGRAPVLPAASASCARGPAALPSLGSPSRPLRAAAPASPGTTVVSETSTAESIPVDGSQPCKWQRLDDADGCDDLDMDPSDSTPCLVPHCASGSDDQELIPCMASQAAALAQQMQFMHAQQQTQLQAEQAAQQQALLQQQQQQWAASAVPRYQG